MKRYMIKNIPPMRRKKLSPPSPGAGLWRVNRANKLSMVYRVVLFFG
jgi:hypothetical protein